MSSKGSGFIQALIGAILGSVITMLVISQNILPFMQNINPNTQNNNPQTASINVEGDNPETIYKAVVQKAMPSVVGITTVSTQNDFLWSKANQRRRYRRNSRRKRLYPYKLPCGRRWSCNFSYCAIL